YSSGMQMRVAFSLATAIRPEILIVDEALAVGDAYFVHKCFKRIREFRDAGTTLLIVSHDKSAVQSLCDRAVMLDKGKMVADGTPQEVLDLYNAMIAEKENATVRQLRTEGGAAVTVSGTGEATIERIWLEDRHGNPVQFIGVGDQADLVIRVCAKSGLSRLVIGYMIRDRLGQSIWHQYVPFRAGDQECIQWGCVRIACVLPDESWCRKLFCISCVDGYGNSSCRQLRVA